MYESSQKEIGRISSVVVQEPTGYKSIDGYMIYETEEIIFQKDGIYQLCEIVKKDHSFYGVCEDDQELKQYLLMDNDYAYEFIEVEMPDYDDE